MSGFWDSFSVENDIVKPLKNLANPVVSAITSPFDELKKTAVKWHSKYIELKNIPDSQLSPELLTEKRALLKRGDWIIKKIRLMGVGSDIIADRNMGFVPIVAGGVIAASAGLMLYWITDYLKFKEKYAEYKTLKDSGKSPKQAATIVNSITKSNNIFSDMNGLTKSLIFGGVALTLYKLVNKK